MLRVAIVTLLGLYHTPLHRMF